MGVTLGALAVTPRPDGARYVAATLPQLPFRDGRFAMTLSGFLLFTHPDLLDHRAALRELVRVTSGEVRVYPLHDTAGEPYAELRGPARGRDVDGGPVDGVRLRAPRGRRPDAGTRHPVITAPP